jgi:Gamma-aminobutyrate permease and related permeases
MEEKIKVKALEKENLTRGLKPRHMWMMALGSAIGTGLFYGSAGAIKLAGPSAIVSYAIVGVMIFFIVRGLGEMCVAEPVSGGVVAYADRYLGRFFGFFLGWSTLFTGAATSSASYNALGRYVQFWFPDVPIWVCAAVGVTLIVIVNMIAVRIYGEVEFWVAGVKVTAIISMIVLGLLIILFGVGNGGVPVGFGNLVDHGGFFAGGLWGIFLSLVLVAFAYGGVENIGVAAGEAQDPSSSIPKAINGVLGRIAIFYIGAITVLVTLFPWDQIGLTGSPFVVVFAKIGIPAAATILNLVVITAVFSAMNGTVYNASRKVYKLAVQGNAPNCFGKVTRKGTPYIAILLVISMQLFGVAMNYIIPADAFAYFSSIVAMLQILQWGFILLCQLRFRKVRIHNKEEDSIKFKMPFWPYSNYIALAFLLLIIVAMGFQPSTRIALYVMPLWIAGIYIFYRIYCNFDAKPITQNDQVAKSNSGLKG